MITQKNSIKNNYYQQFSQQVKLVFYHTIYAMETKKQLALCNIDASISHLEG